jgi:hypothetical protein
MGAAMDNQVGMLWFDNDPKADLPTKVKRAVDYYVRKYAGTPTICYVHPSLIPTGLTHAGNLEVRANRSVLPNHFWLCIGNRP